MFDNIFYDYSPFQWEEYHACDLMAMHNDDNDDERKGADDMWMPGRHKGDYMFVSASHSLLLVAAEMLKITTAGCYVPYMFRFTCFFGPFGPHYVPQ